jgi:phosphomethylpyrimidine synthase
MKITQDVRTYEAGLTDNERADLKAEISDIQKGMDEMSAKFKEMGKEIDVPV